MTTRMVVARGLAAVGPQRISLAPGDSADFAADVGHSYANRSSEPRTYYVVALVMRRRQ
ncbi:MAG TPA: hypothetical protein VF337_00170 [Candidatus Limnocylindrales bacterium]